MFLKKKGRVPGVWAIETKKGEGGGLGVATRNSAMISRGEKEKKGRS